MQHCVWEAWDFILQNVTLCSGTIGILFSKMQHRVWDFWDSLYNLEFLGFLYKSLVIWVSYINLGTFGIPL